MDIWKVLTLSSLMIWSGCNGGGSTSSPKNAGEYRLDLESSEGRLAALVRANIIASHAYQVGLAMEKELEEGSCYGAEGMSREELGEIVAMQKGLVNGDLCSILSWVDGESSQFNPNEALLAILESPLELAPSLPVNVFMDYIKQGTDVPGYQLGSVANLYQTCLEVDRDGTLLWDLYHFYIALGLPVYVGQFGLPGEDSGLGEG